MLCVRIFYTNLSKSAAARGAPDGGGGERTEKSKRLSAEYNIIYTNVGGRVCVCVCACVMCILQKVFYPRQFVSSHNNSVAVYNMQIL